MSDDNKDQKNTSHKNDTDSKKDNNFDKGNIVFYDNSNPTAKKTSVPQHHSEDSIPITDKNSKGPRRMAPKKKKENSKKRIIINTVSIILSVLLIVSGSFFIIVYSYFNRINYKAIDKKEYETSKTTSSVTSQSSSASSLPKVDAYSGTLLNDQMVLNVMLIGADTRSDSKSGNSDTMILLTVDTRNKKLKLLSFMRDTYLEIPGHENNKLNASYSIGGAELTVRTIEANYGIMIDRYSVVDFSSFKNIIDTIGGIDVDLTYEEIDYINWQYWINKQSDYKNADSDSRESVRAQLRDYWLSNQDTVEKPIKVEDCKFHKNKNGDDVSTVHLNGKEALWHARNRGEDQICSGDDYTRTQRQRNVLGILINKMKKSDFSTVLRIIYEIGPMVTTNLKTSEITSLATNITKYLKYDIVSKSAPESSNNQNDFYYGDVDIDGSTANCIIINDWNAFRQKVAEFVFDNEVKQSSSTQSSKSASKSSGT